MDLRETTGQTIDLVACAGKLQCTNLSLTIETLHTIYFYINKSLSVFITMKTVRFSPVVDPDVNYSDTEFRNQVTIYLNDPDGWGSHYLFQYTPDSGKVIRLCKPKTIKEVGCEKDDLSCATVGGNKIWLNADRWIHGSKPSKLPLEEYRQYMVSHEMGHSLGYEHVKCPGSGPAPVMMQQTLGIGSCEPNTKLTKIDLYSK